MAKDKKGGFNVDAKVRGLSIHDIITVFSSVLEDFEENAVNEKN